MKLASVPVSNRSPEREFSVDIAFSVGHRNDSGRLTADFGYGRDELQVRVEAVIPGGAVHLEAEQNVTVWKGNISVEERGQIRSQLAGDQSLIALAYAKGGGDGRI